MIDPEHDGRIWLEVSFDEKEDAKTLRARWDPQERSWYAPPGVALEPLARWLVDMSALSGPRIPLRLLGLAIRCWRCGAPTVCVVGFTEGAGLGSSYDLVSADDDLALSIAARLLGEDRRIQQGIGPIRKRSSRTMMESYVSNGCHQCDALQGNHFLFHEELPEVLAEEGTDGLVDLGSFELATSMWQQICESAL